MKTIKLVLVALIMTGTSVFAQDYTADAVKSTIKWTGKKVGGEHYGMIQLKDGSFNIKDGTLQSGEFNIDMTTITNEDMEGEWSDKLVGHLHSEDFFSTDKYKTATLSITEATKFSKGVATVKGSLTIKGVSHPISFSVNQDGESFKASISIDRTLYGIKYGSGKFFDNLGDNMIDDLFILEVHIVTK